MNTDERASAHLTEGQTRPTSPCDLTLDELLCGPGGWTTCEFDGEKYVREDVYEYANDFAHCALERLDRVLAEAERRGITREVMERVSDHASAAEPLPPNTPDFGAGAGVGDNQ